MRLGGFLWPLFVAGPSLLSLICAVTLVDVSLLSLICAVTLHHTCRYSPACVSILSLINNALEATMSRDVENTLLISDDEIMGKTDPELKVLTGAWALVPPTQLKGRLWPGAKFPKGTVSKGALKKAEKQEAVEGAMQSYGDATAAAMRMR